MPVKRRPSQTLIRFRQRIKARGQPGTLRKINGFFKRVDAFAIEVQAFEKSRPVASTMQEYRQIKAKVDRFRTKIRELGLEGEGLYEPFEPIAAKESHKGIGLNAMEKREFTLHKCERALHGILYALEDAKRIIQKGPT
tara:strand:- start:106 stop:522 length:417 start_codon:yes stop_codon:yes gene_type:complete